MTSTADQETAGTSARILDSAERLLQVRGYNGFSYGDIAAELNITTAALHYHFADGTLGFAGPARQAARLVLASLEGAMLVARCRDDGVPRFESAAAACSPSWPSRSQRRGAAGWRPASR